MGQINIIQLPKRLDERVILSFFENDSQISFEFKRMIRKFHEAKLNAFTCRIMGAGTSA